MSAFDVKRGRFTAQTTTGNQAVTGLGFQPKAVILLAAGRLTATGYAASAITGVGIATGPTQRKAIASIIRNVAGSTGQSSNHHADAAFKFRTNTDGNVGAADFVSFDADGFTLNWTTAPAAAYIVEYLALGGTALQAKVGHVQQPNATTAAQVLTGLGFAPEALMLMSTGTNATPTTGGSTDASGQLGFGFAARDGSRAAVAHFLANLTSPQDVGSFTSSAEALAAFNSKSPNTAATNLDLELYVDSFDADGWTAHASPASARIVFYHYLALGGVAAKVVTATQPSSTGNQAITGVGFTPRAVIALSAQEATSDDAAATPNTVRNLRRVLGVADAASSSCIWASAQDALVNNTDADSGQHDELMRFSDNAQAKLAGATVASFDADGVTLNWNTADASGRQFRLLLLGPAPQTVGAGGIATSESLGSPAVAGPVSADSIASGEAFGQPAVVQLGAPLTVAAESVDSSETFGAPVVVPDQLVEALSIGTAEGVGPPAIVAAGPDFDFSSPIRHGLTLKWAITSLDRSFADDPEPWEQLVTGSGLEGSQVEIPLDDMRTATLELSVFDRMAAYVRPYERMLKCWLAFPWDTPDLLVFWGPITQPVWNYAEGKVTVNALDPGVRLQSHYLTIYDPIVDKHNAPWKGTVPIDGVGIRMLRDAGRLWPSQIAFGIPSLGIADGFDTTTHEDPESTSRLTIGAQRGDKVWDKMIEVTSFEGGPDFELEPSDDEPGVYAVLNTADRLGRDLTRKVLLADGVGPDNAAVTYEPGPDLITYVHVRSEDGKKTLTVRDPDAAHKYGIYASVEDLQGNVPAANWQSILRQRGEAVLGAYSTPPKNIEVEPQPVSAYHYGLSFVVGDTVRVAAQKGYAPRLDEEVRIKKVTLAKSPEGVKETLEVVPHIDASDVLDETEGEAAT